MDESSSNSVQQMMQNFPDAVLLTIYANPLLVDYFSENIPLLYMLDTLRSNLSKEWQTLENVTPCQLKHNSTSLNHDENFHVN